MLNKTIRFAQEGDISQMLSIYAPIIEETSISFEIDVPSEDEFTKRVAKALTQLPWLVCESGSDLLGYAYAGPHRVRKAYERSIDVSVYVDQKFHKQKVGKSLYISLFNIVKFLGIHNAYAGITLPNEASVNFHRSFGFEQVGVYRSVGFKHGQWHDVSWWQLSLQDDSLSLSPLIPLSHVRDTQEISHGLKSGESA